MSRFLPDRVDYGNSLPALIGAESLVGEGLRVAFNAILRKAPWAQTKGVFVGTTFSPQPTDKFSSSQLFDIIY